MRLGKKTQSNSASNNNKSVNNQNFYADYSNGYQADSSINFDDAYEPPQQQQPPQTYYDPSYMNNARNDNYQQNFYQPQIPASPQPPQQLLQQQQQQQQSPFTSQQTAHGAIFNPNQNNIAANLLNDPMASMAVKYGSALADQGKAYVTQNVDKWFSISKLKYYFAVDTSYVAKKLFLLICPFFNRDWTVKYDQNQPVPPKLDTNAPDMYIPVMAFVTYILAVGIALGTDEKFSPEQLGINASSALGWFVIEVILIMLSLQILSVKSLLKTFDIMAFCGYKYFGMILCIIANLLLSSTGYNAVLAYMCISITYFMVFINLLIIY